MLMVCIIRFENVSNVGGRLLQNETPNLLSVTILLPSGLLLFDCSYMQRHANSRLNLFLTRSYNF